MERNINLLNLLIDRCSAKIEELEEKISNNEKKVGTQRRKKKEIECISFLEFLGLDNEVIDDLSNTITIDESVYSSNSELARLFYQNIPEFFFF